MKRFEQMMNQESHKSQSSGGECGWELRESTLQNASCAAKSLGRFPLAVLGVPREMGGVTPSSYTIPTVAFTDELLVLPASICNHLK